MRFLTFGFSFKTIPSEPLIHGLTPFRIRLRIREIIRKSRCHSGGIDSAVSASAVSMTHEPKFILSCEQHMPTKVVMEINKISNLYVYVPYSSGAVHPTSQSRPGRNTLLKLG
jgi:hypothetical protein